MANWQYYLYVVLAPLATVVLGAVIGHLWRYRKVRGASTLILYLFCASGWLICNMLQLAGVSEAASLFFAKLSFVFIAGVTLSWLAFALDYTGKSHWLTFPRFALFCIVPAITNLLAQTNEWHGMIWRTYNFVPIDSLLSMRVTYGDWFWIHTLYTYGSMLLGAFIIGIAYFRSYRVYSHQAVLLIAGALTPVAANFAYLFHLIPDQQKDYSPLGYAFAGVAFVIARSRYQLFDLKPVARNVLIDQMSDSMIVLDEQHRIIDINPAARKLLGVTEQDLIGKPINQLPGALGEHVQQRRDVHADESIIAIGQDSQRRYYDVRISPLNNQENRSAGQLIVARDITERVQTDETLYRREQQYRTLAENSPDLIVRVGKDKRYQYVSPASTKIMGITPQDLIGTTWRASNLPASVSNLFDDVFARVFEAKEETSIEWWRKTPTEPQWFQSSIVPELARDGSVETVLSITRDITERKRSDLEKARHLEADIILEERRRIAREIHDGLAQDLASLRLRMNVWQTLLENDPTRLRGEFDHVQDLLAENIREVRRSIFALRPLVLDKLGFFPALQLYVGAFREQFDIRANLRILGQAEILPRPLEPVLMRLIQEAVINVGKHAHPRLVDVTLDLRSVDQVTLTVQDDGVGFDLACLAEAAQHGHYGLTQMRERVASLRGRFTIDSQPGQGTLVRVVLPFQAIP